MTTAAVLLAGGSGLRLGRTDNKVFAAVGGRSLLAWSLAAFVDHVDVDSVILVVRATDRRRVSGMLAQAGLSGSVRTATGGASRQASELAGLRTIAAAITSGVVDVVAIHDVARPFATRELIARTVHTARDIGGAVPVLPLGSGIYRATGSGTLIAQSTDLYRVQTPQAFRSGALLAAYRAAADERFEGVDTVETVQRYTSLDVSAVRGDPENIKVTFPADLATAERIAATRGGRSDAAG